MPLPCSAAMLVPSALALGNPRLVPGAVWCQTPAGEAVAPKGTVRTSRQVLRIALALWAGAQRPGPHVHHVLALLLGDRAGDAQAVLVDLQFDVVPGDPGEFGLDQVELLGLVDLDVRLPRRLVGSLRGELVVQPPHAVTQVLELADRVPQCCGLEERGGEPASAPD